MQGLLSDWKVVVKKAFYLSLGSTGDIYTFAEL